MAQKTAFYSIHQQLNAKIIDFGGFDMPVQYQGIRVEHNAVREAVGLFDVSHMGEFFVQGPQAEALIQYVTINHVTKLQIGQAQYSAMCYEDGGIVDDLLVYKLADDRFMLVVNASNIQKDFEWIANYASRYNCEFANESDAWSLLALQGPKAPEVLQKLTDSSLDVNGIKFYTFTQGEVAGMGPVIISATGYTGEKGFELYFRNDEVQPEAMWNALMQAGEEAGIQPCGLGARDTLRLEKGYALYGNDIDQSTNPIEAKMGWLTKTDKGEFVGREPILKAKEGVDRKLVAFVVDENKSIARHGYAVVDPAAPDQVIGHVTSGTQSITTGNSIGMAYVKVDFSGIDSQIAIQIRKKIALAKVVKLPFC